MSGKFDFEIPPIVRGTVVPRSFEIENAKEEERRAERKLQHIHLWINTSAAVGALIVSIISLIVSLAR